MKVDWRSVLGAVVVMGALACLFGWMDARDAAIDAAWQACTKEGRCR